MDHPALLPRNNGNDNQRNHDQTCTKQLPAITRQKESTLITQESDPCISISTVEIVSSNDILQAALRPSTILKDKNYQAKWNNYYMENKISHMHSKISELYNSGVSYSVRNFSKSDLFHVAFLPPYSI